MKLIHSDNEKEIYLEYFQGKQVRFCKNLKTGEILINSEDVAKILGFKSADEMIKTNAVLDLMNIINKETAKAIN